MKFLRVVLLAVPLLAVVPRASFASDSSHGGSTAPAAESDSPPALSIEERLKSPPDRTLKISVPGAAVEDAKKNADHFFDDYRAVPNFSGGKPQGLKFLSLKAGSFLEKSGLVKGDILVAVDGVPIDIKTAGASIQAGIDKDKTEYFVLRNGEFVQIAVSHAKK